MGPLRKNSDYCKKYRQTHADEYRKKDRERKKLERDSRKNLGPKQQYEEYKALDRARKEIAKLKKQLAETTPQQTSTPVPSTDSSSVPSTSSSFETPSAYKHRATKSRSVNRAEKGLPKSPSKRKEVLTSLSRKFNLEGLLPQKRKAGRKPLVLSEEEEKWVAEKLDDPSVSHTNPGRNDSIYLGKVNGVKHFEQKRFLLWPLRDLVDILNGNNEAAGGEETFPQKFGRNLRFTEFYKFVKKHKQYVFNSKIPHYNCLCEICENTILLAKALNKSAHTKKIPTDPHAIVQHYCCEEETDDCLLGSCQNCAVHGLTCADFYDDDNDDNGGRDSDASDSSETNSRSQEIKFYTWMKNDEDHLTKMLATEEIEDCLRIWQEKVTHLKRHIHTKRKQQQEYNRIKNNLQTNEILIHLDYSENYKSKQQNAIQSAYFGNTSFSLFTACAYYRDITDDNKLKTIPLTITSELNDKSRASSLSCVNAAISYVRDSIPNGIQVVHVFSDGCAAQFRSRFVFALASQIHTDIELQWHYSEAHHGKGPMDGIGGTIKRMVFRKVLSKQVVINSPKQFADFADTLSKVNCLYLPQESLIEEPSFVAEQKPIPDTLKTHKWVRYFNRAGTAYNNFYFLSSDIIPHYKQWYGLGCDHIETDVDDNTCAQCFEKYGDTTEDWIECKACIQWFHEKCFFEQ